MAKVTGNDLRKTFAKIEREQNIKLFVFIGFIFLIAAIINITAIVFAIINGFALFGPDGDINSIWHWFWFIICCMILLGNVFRASK